MDLLYIRSVKLVDRSAQAVLVMNGIIQAVADQAALTCPPGAVELDGRGATLAPGLIELQINGGFGSDFTRDPETIWQVGSMLPQFGVTTFLPTVITSPLETIAQATRTVTTGRPADYRGAEPLGLHLEGPFLNPLKKGAHNAKHLRLPEPRLVETWTPANGVRLVTLAPELPGALETITSLARRGVLVSAGHSMANRAEAEAGIAAGIRMGTHLFNAMPALEHRAANLTSVLLTDERVGFGVIADGVHIDPLMADLAWKLRGGRGFVLVTDAVGALGMPPGVSHLGDFDVIVDDRSVRLADGTLAGSILSQDAALRNLMRFTGCALSEAVAAFTAEPARLLGLNDRGQIKAGMRADFVLLDDNLNVLATLVNGEVVYQQGRVNLFYIER